MGGFAGRLLDALKNAEFAFLLQLGEKKKNCHEDDVDLGYKPVINPEKGLVPEERFYIWCVLSVNSSSALMPRAAAMAFAIAAAAAAAPNLLP